MFRYLNDGPPLDRRGDISASDVAKLETLMARLEVTKVPAFTGGAKENDDTEDK